MATWCSRPDRAWAWSQTWKRSPGIRGARPLISDTEAMVKIVIPDDSPPVYQDHPELMRLRQFGEVEVFGTKAASEEEMIERLRGADVAINVRAYSVFSEQV